MADTKVNIEEQVKLLVELQGLDTQIFRIERDIAAIPEDIKHLEDLFKDKTSNLKSLEDGLKTLQLKRKEKEGDLEAKEVTIKKHQGQLYQVKTNKEYSALEQEISRIKADNSLIEEDIIKILDQVDQQNRDIAREREVVKSEEAKLNEEKKKKSEELKRLEEDLARLKVQRLALSEKIDKIILSKYERIVRNKDGLAVVPIISESCQGCFRVLPPQVIHEAKMRKDIILCDNCSRILYIED